MVQSDFYYSLLNKFSIVAITDKFGIIIYANENFCKISQYAKAELIGQNHRIVKSGYHPKSYYNDLWATISSGQIWRGEICNKTKSGTYYWVDTFIIPETDELGEIKQFYSIRIDITSRKKQELEILRQKQELERIATMQSHQVRKPVANVIGLIGLLEEENLNDTNKKLLSLLKMCAAELEGCISDIVNKAE
jgi:PAS domain S-box-containing protein